ncbi:GTP-binding protein [Bacillus thuringiensis]|uniref:GTP-binding protein n=1 Tax=Bacillus thuringiensis TaxID=1428 RepID=UPI0011454839|nr:GTP-binding protein [Bacillus thuringiensis]
MKRRKNRNQDTFQMVADYVKQGKTVLIGGTLGSGKTTLLKELLSFTGDDKVVAVGWDVEMTGITCSNVTVRDKQDDNIPQDIVKAVENGEAIRLAYDNVRGESIVSAMKMWEGTGKGLGTVVTTSMEMLIHCLLLRDMEMKKATREEATERFVKTFDILVFMGYKHKDIQEIVEVDKQVTNEVRVLPVAKAVEINWE